MRKALSAAKSLLTAALGWTSWFDRNILSGNFRLARGSSRQARRRWREGDQANSRILRENRWTSIARGQLQHQGTIKSVAFAYLHAFQRSINEISHYTDQICDLRNSGRNDENLAATCAQKLKELVGTKHSSGQLSDALSNAQRHGAAHPAHTAAGRLEQALRWLDNPGVDDGGVGMQAIRMLTEDARKLADRLNPQDRLNEVSRKRSDYFILETACSDFATISIEWSVNSTISRDAVLATHQKHRLCVLSWRIDSENWLTSWRRSSLTESSTTLLTSPLHSRFEQRNEKAFEMKIVAIRRSSPCRPLHAQQGAELRREGQQADRSLAIDDTDCSTGMMRRVLDQHRKSVTLRLQPADHARARRPSRLSSTLPRRSTRWHRSSWMPERFDFSTAASLPRCTSRIYTDNTPTHSTDCDLMSTTLSTLANSSGLVKT